MMVQLLIWTATAARVRVCFFFQAEDGIRDLTVTGVQTCALPIFDGLAAPVDEEGRDGLDAEGGGGVGVLINVELGDAVEAGRLGGQLFERGRDHAAQIGRASCRERV